MEIITEKITNKGQGNNSPVGFYNPESCPCEYGICNECLHNATRSYNAQINNKTGLNE